MTRASDRAVLEGEPAVSFFAHFCPNEFYPDYSADPPSLMTRAPDQVVLEGDSAINLTCAADGEPAPNIKWTKVFVNGSDSDVLFTGEKFILPNYRTNAGTYRCKASNGIGSDVNHTVKVVVNCESIKRMHCIK